MNELKKLKVLFILVRKGHAETINRFLIENGLAIVVNFFAEGIKKNYFMDVLGDEKNRDIIFTIVDDKKYKIIYFFLKNLFDFEKASMNGMLLVFDISSIAGVSTYKFLSDYNEVLEHGN
ncbi:MAG: hypothetical protein J6Y70_00645 [Bacilli bacterium]|nr:hypothetical protein [Bacilli bacterium]